MRDNLGNVIEDTTLFLLSGLQRVYLDFNVPIASDMQLGVANNSLQTNGLYRNNSGANYPYDIASAVSITKSSASTAPYSYYYFFYDIEVEILCLDVSSIVDNINSHKKLLKSINVLGIETKEEKNVPLFYIYDDGSVEKKMIVQ